MSAPAANPPALPHRLLVIDDEPDLRTLYELSLLREGYDVETAGSVEEALRCLAERRYGGVITDMRLPDGSGLDVLRSLEDGGRAEKTIVITAYGSAENAVEALRAGAYDYLTKPVDLKQFRAVVASALGRTPGAPTPAQPRATAAASPPPKPRPGDAVTPATPAAAAPESPALRRMAGRSVAMQAVRQLVEKVARSMAPVLINGESGTGKELVARAVHEVGARRAGPFIAVNCGAIPEHLLESEFFGYRKGAFTGAAEDREGFFQAASGGTLFLDEIGDLPLPMQSKLLRAVQERAVRPVGALHEVPVTVRLLSATHKELATEVQAGRFRQDLFYRLNVIQIRVPPLRERLDDLGLISERVLERIASDAGVVPAPRLTAQALAKLARHGFPGNVRELENLLHRALALSAGDVLDAGDLGLDDAADGAEAVDAVPPTAAAGAVAGASAVGAAGRTLDPTVGEPLPGLPVPALPADLAGHLDAVERDILVRALDQYRGNRTAAGASLGLSLRQMRYRMARLGIGGSVADSLADGGAGGSA